MCWSIDIGWCGKAVANDSSPSACCIEPWPRTASTSALSQKDIIRRVGYAEEGARFVAWSARYATSGVDTLYVGHARKFSITALVHDIELEPRDIVLRRTRSTAGQFGVHYAPIDVLPAWTRVMAPNGATLEDKRGNRFTGPPGELAFGCGPALVDLGSLGMEHSDQCQAGRCNCCGDLRRELARSNRSNTEREHE